MATSKKKTPGTTKTTTKRVRRGPSAPETVKTPPAKPRVAKVGVIATILAELRKATKDKPVTKAQLGERLAKAFPDKEPTGLARTVSCQVPGRISREQEVTVKSDGEGGFWIA